MKSVKSQQRQRVTGGHYIKMKDGRRENIYSAMIVYKCIHCLGDLEIKCFGLKCQSNDSHYGFIHRDEAKNLTTEERFMKLSDMFPSEYLRGIDISEPRKMKIIKVSSEMVRNRENNKTEPEYILFFEGEEKKLRLNWTMAKEIHVGILGLNADDDVDKKWPGNYVTVYRTKVKAFGKEHIVPRIRKCEPGDKLFPPAGKEKALNTLTRSEFWARVKRDITLPVEVSKFILVVAGLDGDYAPENAQKIWKVLESDGKHLDTFLDAVLEQIPYYQSKADVLKLMTEWNTGYEFTENFEMELTVVLENHAKQEAAQKEAEGDNQPSLDEIFEGNQ